MAEPFRPKARRPRGLADRRGAPLEIERNILQRVLAVYEVWGFERLETSAFEYADALGKFLPDQDRPNEGVFSLQDDDEQWLALRYDLTAPLARFVAENFDALPKPYRRAAAGPVWRNEKPGPGRFREFWQCDADTVGSASPAADAEIIAMAGAALQAAGVGPNEYSLKVNTRKLLNAVLEAAGVDEQDHVTRLAVLRSVDKLDRLGLDGVRQLLGAGRKDESGDFAAGAKLAPTAVDRVLGFVAAGRPSRAETLSALAEFVGGSKSGEEGLAELGAIDSVLTALGVDDARAQFDPTIVRGLEYYTGPVFEAQVTFPVRNDDGTEVSIGSVGGGGRYDDLVSRFKGQLIPATGFSIGVSRLAAALALRSARAEAPGPVVILSLDAAHIAESFALSQELRAAGVPAEVYLGASGMKAQMKYADKRNAPLAVICGEDERARGVVAIKDLGAGARLAAQAGEDRKAWKEGQANVQIETPRDDFVDAVRRLLAGGAS